MRPAPGPAQLAPVDADHHPLAAAEEGRAGVLTLGFDPILWGVLMPVLRLLEL